MVLLGVPVCCAIKNVWHSHGFELLYTSSSWQLSLDKGPSLLLQADSCEYNTSHSLVSQELAIHLVLTQQ